MANFNLAGQKIKDTYTQVAQVNGTTLVNGSGTATPIATSSIVNFPTEVSRSAAAAGFGAGGGGGVSEATFTAYTSSNDNKVDALIAATSSYLTSLPSGVVSSSAQVNLSQATGTAANATSASHAELADYATSAGNASAADQATLVLMTGTSTNSTYRVVFASSNGFQGARIDSEALAFYYNPATNALAGLNSVTSTNFYGNATTATTASHAIAARSSSYATNATSASYALSSLSSSYASNSSTSDSATTATSASYALTASYVSGIAAPGLVSGTGTDSLRSSLTSTPATATGNYSVVIGDSAQDGGNDYSVVLGKNARAVATIASHSGSIAIGQSSYALGTDSIVIGSRGNINQASYDESFAIGKNTNIGDSANRATILGHYASADGQGNVAIGYESNATGSNSIAIGYQITTTDNEINIGGKMSTPGTIGTRLTDWTGSLADSSVLIGKTSNDPSLVNTGGVKNVQIGTNVRVVESSTRDNVVAIGADISTAQNAVAIGQDIQNNTDSGVAIGKGSRGFGNAGIAIGAGAKQYGSYSVSLGYGSIANSNDSIAIGRDAQDSDSNREGSIQIGYDTAAAQYGIGFGYNAEGNGDSAIGIGSGARGNANYTIAIGRQATSYQQNAIIIGDQLTATVQNEINIGGKLKYNSTNSGSFVMEGAVSSPTQTLSIVSSAVAVDGGSSNFFKLAAGGASATISNPTNLMDGVTYIMKITNGQNLSWGTNYNFEGGVAPTLTSGTDIVSFASFGDGQLYCSYLLNLS